MKKTITIITMILLSMGISAQEKAVTMKGDTIIVYENGTWEKINKVEKVVDIESTVEATVEVDEFSKSKKTRTESWTKFGKNKLGKTINGSLIKVDDITVFTISYYGDLGCLSKYDSTMKVKLTNGEIIEFSQISDTDCGDYPTASFIPITKEQTKDPNFKDLLADNIEILKQFDWETIRIQGTKYYTDIIPNVSRKMEKPEQFFRQHLISADKK
ncbi:MULTISPECIES: hypothetical protein [Winogradskyella]|uniref:hypothetical protein n=1 Tax=Winogradskyella TaxID=286104 RepID=UPI0015CBB23D|nr:MULTISPECIES: hypothetical protein [Winogradskyella]QXP79040.1 hypothetical protein H0I32_17875 [Winogradskyella sp. HaHa_3_26]